MAAREIARFEPELQGLLLKSHAALVAAIYIVLSPLTLLILPYADLPNFLIWWFFPILVLEHINQELYRLLIVLSKQVQASLLLFLRQGSWALTAAGMLVDESSRTSEGVPARACRGMLACTLRQPKRITSQNQRAPTFKRLPSLEVGRRDLLCRCD